MRSGERGGWKEDFVVPPVPAVSGGTGWWEGLVVLAV